MSDAGKARLSWLFVMLTGMAAAALFYGASPVGASDDHDRARELRRGGDIVPLAELLDHAELNGLRVLEAELEDEDGRLVYELQLLDGAGRVHEKYFDAASGQPLKGRAGD
jgi:uncharacterized membrane protein YkoI